MSPRAAGPQPPRHLDSQWGSFYSEPRILGPDAAGLVTALGEGVEGLSPGARVVVNPGIRTDDRITVIGQHTHGTYCELKAFPRGQLYPLDDSVASRRAPPSPSSSETAYRTVVSQGGPFERPSGC